MNVRASIGAHHKLLWLSLKNQLVQGTGPGSSIHSLLIKEMRLLSEGPYTYLHWS